MRRTVVVNTRNRMLSQNLYMSLDTRHTDLNNNILLIGGSGAGKTYRFVKPCLMQMNGSYVITDPKGEIMRSSAGFLKHFGYQVKVINLLNEKGMKKSTRYNPLRYVMSDTDIEKLVTTFMTATEKKNSQGGDQFWDNSAGILLQAFAFYAYYEGVEVDGQVHHDFKGIMKLVNMCHVKENPKTGVREDTQLDLLFKKLERKNPNHRAVIDYNKVMVGAPDTIRSVISVLNSRTACLQSKAILDLLSDDEMDIQSIGVRKTVVYCMISDLDQTYNFLVSMLYRQMYQQMYEQADTVYGGALPVHVTFLLDEFANGVTRSTPKTVGITDKSVA
ncbi:MAG: type IV secretory system conjugative DNA transfer family protein [Lachnospiraceae bacterium]|nr:type IV secretory system conjugative DNA transfer family protein [Lachnospiraceae bacterium]